MKAQLRIVFMGTPEFAVASLAKLYHSRHQIVGVVTAPDKPAGRGSKLRTSAIKDYAIANNLTLLQPVNLKDESFIEQLQALNPDLLVVVAFRMLPEVIWQLPPQGTINLHASLLPDYRGAAPINWAIINGETETGVTTFFINEKIDTGDIIDQQKVSITNTMNAGELHDQLTDVGAALLLKTVDAIAESTISPISQDKIEHRTKLSEAPKLDRSNTKIQWYQPAPQVLNLIRGLSPYPGAYTFNSTNNSIVKILKASAGDKTLDPGEILFSKHQFEVGTESKSIQIEEIQTPGKKRMQIADFLNGANPESFKQFE